MRSTQSYVPASSSPYRLLSSSVMAREANLARRPPVTTTAPPGATGSERSLGSGVACLTVSGSQVLPPGLPRGDLPALAPRQARGLSSLHGAPAAATRVARDRVGCGTDDAG